MSTSRIDSETTVGVVERDLVLQARREALRQPLELGASTSR